MNILILQYSVFFILFFCLSSPFGAEKMLRLTPLYFILVGKRIELIFGRWPKEKFPALSLITRRWQKKFEKRIFTQNSYDIGYFSEN